MKGLQKITGSDSFHALAGTLNSGNDTRGMTSAADADVGTILFQPAWLALRLWRMLLVHMRNANVGLKNSKYEELPVTSRQKRQAVLPNLFLKFQEKTFVSVALLTVRGNNKNNQNVACCKTNRIEASCLLGSFKLQLSDGRAGND